MMHIRWVQKGQVPNLPEMQASVARHGGAIVQYEIVFSALLFCRTTKHLEWVPPYRSRAGVGLKYALWSFAIGWWSLFGLLATPTAIVNDLLGGADVTGLVAPEVATVQNRAKARKELKQITERSRLVLLGLFILGIGAMALIAIYG